MKGLERRRDAGYTDCRGHAAAKILSVRGLTRTRLGPLQWKEKQTQTETGKGGKGQEGTGRGREGQCEEGQWAVDVSALGCLAPAACRPPPSCQVALLPRVEELPGLRPVDPGAPGRLQELREAGCMEAARTGPPGAMPEACARLVCSISALLYGGGLCECVSLALGPQERGQRGHRGVRLILPFLLPACECHPQGSLSTECALLGGQCPCRPNVSGRTCDHCVPGTYGFGPTGCSGEPSGPVGVGSGTSHLLSLHGLVVLSFPTECRCHSKGATSAICDPGSGQCTCRAGLAGRRCDRCLPDRWGFPHCQPCVCNGHAELCHPLTGVCQACQGATTGRHCERWVLALEASGGR